MELFEALHQARPQGQLHPAAECRGPLPGPGLLLAGPGRHVGAAGGQHDPGLGGAAAAGEGAVPRPRPRPRPAPLLRCRVRCSCEEMRVLAAPAHAPCTQQEVICEGDGRSKQVELGSLFSTSTYLY